MDEMKVLVVDDDTDEREKLVRDLKSNGFLEDNVLGVETGEEALEKVKERPGFFDVVVIDHKLKKGKMNGIKTAKSIRDYSRFSREIYPIIFTNVVSDDPKAIGYFRGKAYEAGAYRYLHRHESGKNAIKVMDFIDEIKQLLQLREKVHKSYEAQQKNPYLLSLTQLDIMIAIIDRGFKFWYTNPAKEKYREMNEFTHTSCPISSRECSKTLHCKGCIINDTFEDGKNHERIYIQPGSQYGDRVRWIKMWTQPIQENGIPILLEDGKPIAVLESSQDITDSAVLNALPMEQRLKNIARALNEREDGFDRVRIYKTDFNADPRGRIQALVANAGYPREIPPATIDIRHLSNLKKSIRYFKRYERGLFHDELGNFDTVFPSEKVERFIQWPLMKGDRLAGVLSVNEAEGGRRCTENGIDIIESYAKEVLKTFELKEDSSEDREIEDIIHELDNILIHKNTPEESLRTLVDEVYRLTRSDNVLIRYVVDEEVDERVDERVARLLLPFVKGPYSEKAPSDFSISNRIFPSVRTIISGLEEIKRNAKNDPDVIHFIETLPDDARKELEDINAYCTEPLIFRNRCIGCLVLVKNGKKHFTRKDIKIAKKVADRMALMVRDYLENIERIKNNYAFEASVDAVAFADLRYTVNFVNPAFLKLWGYADKNEVIGKPIFTFWADRRKAVKVMKKLQSNERWDDEIKASRKDGSTFDAAVKANLVRDASNQLIGYMASIMDVTERNRQEKMKESIYRISEEASSAQDLDALYESIHKIINDLIPADNFYIAIYDEKADTVSFPYFKDEKESSPKLREGKRGMTEYVIRTGKPKLASSEEIKRLEKDGEIKIIGPIPIDWIGIPLKLTADKKNTEKTIGVMATQIYKEGIRYTDEDKDMLVYTSTQIAMAIKRKREEQRKAVMLREIHHRVKNNFSFIKNLLGLQSMQIEDRGLKNKFLVAEDRILSMAMVHEKLYKSDNLSEIDLNRYLNDLIDSLKQSHELESQKVFAESDIENISMDIDRAIPCGLIVNELFTNALKYAFPPEWKRSVNKKANISIQLLLENKKTVSLRVKDNGIGLPGHVNFENPQSLGIKLVNWQTEQINGTVELEQCKGTSVVIKFKV